MSKRIIHTDGSSASPDSYNTRVEIKDEEEDGAFHFSFGDKPKKSESEKDESAKFDFELDAPAKKEEGTAKTTVTVETSSSQQKAGTDVSVKETTVKETVPKKATTKSSTRAATVKAKQEPERATVAVSVPRLNGPGKAYEYWDYKKRCWRHTTDIWVANQVSNGVWNVVWVWFDNGVIHHVLDVEEVQLYCP